MTEDINDFDAAKSIYEELRALDKERQNRILRWVAESLGLSPSVGQQDSPTVFPASGTQQKQEYARPAVSPNSPSDRVPDIKTFVHTKNPSSDIQFATVVAYYYRFEVKEVDRKDSINSEILQDASRTAGWRRFGKPLATLNNAKKQGYLDSAERGSFKINNVGENLVAMTLPGQQGESPAKSNPRNAAKKRSTKKSESVRKSTRSANAQRRRQ
jgi:hypothetical protein